ncbi:hypothetical protein L596_016392 [Steinernema carpocapsae]|uniref:Uncharacterized protein n=1 Tax=Steinernema carpocapsae TaxID=34508 RepID=A0A4U5NHV0_STECR|nr:hypothetical protein L596_016392 [Steinernema carpocapsae]
MSRRGSRDDGEKERDDGDGEEDQNRCVHGLWHSGINGMTCDMCCRYELREKSPRSPRRWQLIICICSNSGVAASYLNSVLQPRHYPE